VELIYLKIGYISNPIW